MKGDVDVSIIQADFDRLALLSREEWDHNSHYHSFLLQHVPPRCSNALELGCGTGTFARLLAERAEHVLPINLSPQMIRIAQDRSGHLSHIDSQVPDVLAWHFTPHQSASLLSIATLH